MLRDLRAALVKGDLAALVQTLHGLGGVGKTQLAIEYAYRHRQGYGVVWWLRAEQQATLAGDYARLAQALALPARGLADQAEVVAAVRATLEERDDWLLIFDNASKPGVVEGYLSRGMGGHVLITSRNPNWRSGATPLRVPVLEREHAVQLLLKRTGCADAGEADALAEALGDLPLALEQAGAYIAATKIGFAAYLERFHTRRAALWREEARVLEQEGGTERQTVATTWDLAREQIGEAAADLLALCAYLAPEAIPRDLLAQGVAATMGGGDRRRLHIGHGWGSGDAAAVRAGGSGRA